MKNAILFFLLLNAAAAKGQSLKDALFSGRLKSDTGSLVRKTDDLSTKIDSNLKKPAEVPVKKITVAAPDSAAKQPNTQTEAVAGSEKTEAPGAPADNNRLMKSYMDSLIITLKEEILSSKKIKNGTYYVFIDYEIDPAGQVTVNNVTVSPESSFLQDEVKQRFLLTAPQLNPVLSSAGKPVKVKRRYNFNITKS
jgi:hypothetical protein